MADDHPAHTKGSTDPAEVDGLKVEGTWRSHQVPILDVAGNSDASSAAGNLTLRATVLRSSSMIAVV